MIDSMIGTRKLYTELVMASQFGAYSFITKTPNVETDMLFNYLSTYATVA
jgi:hypothetical protein